MDNIYCPLCGSTFYANLLDLDCGNLDGSDLYRITKIRCCEKCGHIFNELSTKDMHGLAKYYDNEYAPINVHSISTVADMPGSTNKGSFMRYGGLYELIASDISMDCKLLDIGCATGGCLDFLKLKGLHNLFGIDPSETYINSAKQRSSNDFRIGSAEKIPFDNGTFDVAILDQVLEHLVSPGAALREAGRVLRVGGLLCIGVPDASRYTEMNSFDFIWLQIREHIQHFDLSHLKLIASTEGFEFVISTMNTVQMTSETMMLPNLVAIFKYTGKKIPLTLDTLNVRSLRKNISNYIERSRSKLFYKKEILKNESELHTPVFAWGIAREFLYLYSSAGLKNCNIVGLIDTNPYKQKNFTVNGMKIYDAEILTTAPSDSALVIAAVAHSGDITNEVKELGFKGRILTSLLT